MKSNYGGLESGVYDGTYDQRMVETNVSPRNGYLDRHDIFWEQALDTAFDLQRRLFLMECASGRYNQAAVGRHMDTRLKAIGQHLLQDTGFEIQGPKELDAILRYMDYVDQKTQ